MTQWQAQSQPGRLAGPSRRRRPLRLTVSPGRAGRLARRSVAARLRQRPPPNSPHSGRVTVRLRLQVAPAGQAVNVTGIPGPGPVTVSHGDSAGELRATVAATSFKTVTFKLPGLRPCRKSSSDLASAVRKSRRLGCRGRNRQPLFAAPANQRAVTGLRLPGCSSLNSKRGTYGR